VTSGELMFLVIDPFPPEKKNKNRELEEKRMKSRFTVRNKLNLYMKSFPL